VTTRAGALIFLLPALAIAGPADAAQWTVDHARSRLGFSVLWDREPFVGIFGHWDADIEFDPADLQRAHVTVRVDLASEHSDEAEFDEGLKGALGFDVPKFADAQFRATRIDHDGGDRYVAQGTLTLRGITRPLTLPFTLTFTGTSAHMVGQAQVIRTEFGIGQGMWAAPQPVAHQVTVTVDLTATKSQ